MAFIPSEATCRGCEFVKVHPTISKLQPWCRLARRSLSNIREIPLECPKKGAV
ncbi:MAG: hypothetical protein QMC96_12190 [Methanomicrobiales archaeon]|nr:hypothetical protein [Methanomicrobiales archaeon]